MWRFFLVVAIWHITCVKSKPIENKENMEHPFWYEYTSQLRRNLRHPDNLNGEQQQRYNSDNSDEEYDLIYPRPSVEKRAFALLARWGAINNMGKQRTPIREASISAEPRGGMFRQGVQSLRPVGQPLRWG